MSFDAANPMKVLGISGSLRARSYNTAALVAAGKMMPDDMVLEIVTLHDLPMFNPDTEQTDGDSAAVVRLREAVAAADALLIAAPEYNYSITGALKNAIDWLSRPPDPPINLMPTAILGVGGRLGTSRSQEHLRDIALHNDLRLVQKPEVLVAAGWEKFDDEMNLVDERTAEQLRRLVYALRGLTMRIRATRKRVLVVGRHERTMSRVSSELRELGYEPVGVLDDESAMALIDPGHFNAVIIGGGVEDDSRHAIREFATKIAPQTAIVEPTGPDTVLAALEEALAATG